MSRARNLGISLAAALLAALLVYGVYAVLIRQVKLQDTVQVVVPKAFVPTGTVLTADMLKYRTITREGTGPEMLMQLEPAVGMIVMVPMGKEEPVLQWKLSKDRLLPGPGQAVFSVPKEYVLSVPGSVRAGDSVYLYASGKLGTVRLLPGDVTVASVKSSANMEVDDPKESHLLAMAQNDKESLYASRRDSNGTVEQLNLILTEEEWRLIDEACRSKQNKLVVAFRTSSAEERGKAP